ncbi:hypothetical protein GCM10020358_61710 [Amorphoplanes nipponensis]|uniref:Uncharacterized protein n=1 Tax=Actinoplanes nipponensis TaxID=135950 RepID=A0A919MLI1_9ACTN|nr:hypothetical protein Ani05nite_75080 [Actinoplanes nipponensis]
MRSDGTGQTGRFARLILLACTVFGLATMHTLGHSGVHAPAADPHGAASAGMASLAVNVPLVGMAAPGGMASGATVHDRGLLRDVAVPASAGVCDGRCAHAPGSSPHGGTAGWGVCVAVLGGLAMLVLLALAVAGSRTRGTGGPEPRRRSVVSRGPPVRRRGLALAAGSVLRI